jgi:hypothetical protein
LINEEKRLEQGDFVYNEFDEWKGTHLYAYLKSPDKQQTIDQIEAGGFRYITVPKLWAKAENGSFTQVQRFMNSNPIKSTYTNTKRKIII